MINLFFLKTFVDAAKTGSFRSAALKNFITQPAVTQHIHLLEKRMACRLFEREGKKAVLTSGGKTFLFYAENILKQYEEAKAQLSEIDKQFLGTIRIATIYSIGLYELKPIVKKYLKKFPKVEIHLEYHPVSKIYELVADRMVDFGFVAYPQKRPGIMSEEFREEKLVLVQSLHHPIFKKRKIQLKDLNNTRFVAFAATTPTRRVIDNFLQERGIFPKIVNEYDNIETLKSAIELGIGCSIIPKNTLLKNKDDRALETLQSSDLALTRPLGILYSKGKVFSAPVQAFYKMIIATQNTFEI